MVYGLTWTELSGMLAAGPGATVLSDTPKGAPVPDEPYPRER